MIERFKRSQNFTFVDLGAVFLMGPAGVLVTKGTDLVSIVILNPGESCEVLQLSSDWGIKNGLITVDDLAFSTQNNRMAAKGWIDLTTDSLSIEFGLLNKRGCVLY